MPYLFLAGRILYGGVLVLSGIEHFRYAQVLTVHAGSKGIPAPRVGVIVSGLLIICGGLSILLGFRPTWGIVFVTLFLLPASLFIHNFWSDTDPVVRAANFINFKKNVALLGAAWMFLLVPQPWPLSLTW
jgi:putative oxidoreductase